MRANERPTSSIRPDRDEPLMRVAVLCASAAVQRFESVAGHAHVFLRWERGSDLSPLQGN